MLGWLSKWFSKKQADDFDRIDVYNPQERLIFQYWNGKKIVHADPLVLYKRIADQGPELTQTITVAFSISKAATASYVDMIERFRSIFMIDPPINPIDCSGTLSEVELAELFNKFLTYTERLKKNSRGLQMSSPNSEDCKTFSKENQATSNTADSGSTAAAPSTDVPPPPPVEQPSPSV